MENCGFEETITEIVEALKKQGYSPYSQLAGYLVTGDGAYITRTDNAREKIGALDKGMIREYLNTAEAFADVRSCLACADIAVGF